MIEHASWETEAGLELDEAVAERLVKARTYLGDTVIGQVSGRAKAGADLCDLSEVQRQRFAIYRRLREIGVRVVTSSDAMYPVTPFEDFPWSVVAAARYGGLSAEQAVHSATGLAAEAVGIDAQTGTLVAGKQGDLLLVDGDVAADVRALPRTRWVLRDGRVLAGVGGVWSAGYRGYVCADVSGPAATGPT
jgi:imidazolonepropionase-like amidohydrolase